MLAWMRRAKSSGVAATKEKLGCPVKDISDWLSPTKSLKSAVDSSIDLPDNLILSY